MTRTKKRSLFIIRTLILIETDNLLFSDFSQRWKATLSMFLQERIKGRLQFNESCARVHEGYFLVIFQN